MPQTAAATTQCSDHPAWVLLDTPARIGECHNETTAEAKTSDGHDIAVSFSATDPLGLSRCFVHCPDLTEEDFIGKPCVTGADGALLLIRVTFAPRNDRWKFTDMFVYRAGPGEPSLYLLPRPYPLCILCNHVGVLSCGEHYFVVVPETRFEAGGRVNYDLFVFSSENKSWSTIVAPVALDGDTDYDLMAMHYPTKVMSIGGIWLAWIDLRRGVLLCNVVDKLPEMRLIQLPSLLGANKVDFAPFDGAVPPLRRIRDVSCRNGLLRFIEIEYPVLDDCNDTEFRWTATMFTREICSENWDWRCTLDSADLGPADVCLPDLFPEIWDGKELTLNKVMSSSPLLDLYDDDVFYMMAKLDFYSLDGWVLAINAAKLTLENVVPFSKERFFFEPTYQQCAFSKHFSKASGTYTTSVSEESMSMDGQVPAVVDFVRSVLMAQNQLRQFEKCLADEWPCYDYGRSLITSDHAAILLKNIQELVICATCADQSNAAFEAVAMFMQAFEEIRYFLLHTSWNDDSSYTPASDEDIRNKVIAAVGALDNLLQTLPPEILDEGRLAAVAYMERSFDEDGTEGKFASQSIGCLFPSGNLEKVQESVEGDIVQKSHLRAQIV